jgi:hypothetical protein
MAASLDPELFAGDLQSVMLAPLTAFVKMPQLGSYRAAEAAQ